MKIITVLKIVLFKCNFYLVWFGIKFRLIPKIYNTNYKYFRMLNNSHRSSKLNIDFCRQKTIINWLTIHQTTLEPNYRVHFQFYFLASLNFCWIAFKINCQLICFHTQHTAFNYNQVSHFNELKFPTQMPELSVWCSGYVL